MALKGSLKEFGLADILQLLYFQRKTGILTLEGRMDKVRLLFYEGNIVSAESKRRIEANRLGKVLAKKRLITEEDLQEALKEQQDTGVKIGNVLIKKGIIGKEQIQDIVISQISETVVQIFGWKEGRYEFIPQGVPVDKEIPISLDTQHLLMEGLRIIDEWSLIEGKLTLDTVFAKTGKTGSELTSEEEEVLNFVDGEKDVRMVVESSQMDNFAASKALVSLLEKDIIEPKEAVPVAPVIIEPKKAPRKKVPFPSFVTAVVFLSSIFASSFIFFLQQDKDYAINKIKTAQEISKIREDMEEYRYANGAYPPSIEQITRMTDGWGRAYIYRPLGDDFILLSSGPDGKEGTEDDVY